MNVRFTAGALAVLLLAGCSRAGFEASLNRSNAPSSSGASSSAARETAAFEIATGEVDSNGIYMSYVLPRGTTGTEKAAQTISERIHKVLFDVSDSFDMTGNGAELHIFDGITQNDGTYYSIVYDGEYTPSADAQPQKFRFGLTFDAVTGQTLALSSFFEPQALSVLLTDEQISQIQGRDEQKKAAQRAHLSGLGSAALGERLAKDALEQSVPLLLDASFYIENGRFVVVLSAPQELDGAICVSVAL